MARQHRALKPLRARPKLPEHGTPTRERLAKAGGHVEVGDDSQGARVYTLKDTPLERLSARGGIDPKEYSALMKYKQHWYHAGLQPSLSSMDLNRVFASDPATFSGMAKTDRQVFHRQRYREAVQYLGMRASLIVERVVCAEQTLEVAGLALGYSSPHRARSAATKLLRKAADGLVRFWGMA